MRLFRAKAFLYSYYHYITSNIAAEGITFNVFSYDEVWVEHRGPSSSIKAKHQTQHLPALSLCATCYATNAGCQELS